MQTHASITGLVFALAIVSTPVFGQPVTLADLNGAVVEASVTQENRVRRGDQEFSTQFRQDVKIRFGPGDSITFAITPTSSSPRGVRQGPVRSGTATLGRP